MNAYNITIDILLIILAVVGIVFLAVLVIFLRRLMITVKKADYLIEDITYKIENLNATLETVNKINGYFNLAEAVVKRNVRASLKYIAKNRDLAYKAVDYVRNVLNDASSNKINLDEKQQLEAPVDASIVERN